MALNFGPGVSRTLDPVARAFQNVVFQKGKPPLDSEFNLQDSIHDEQLRQQLAAMMPSGFVFDPTRANEYYGFDPLNSNQFRFGRTNPAENDTPSIIAVVNGMVLQVAGTDISGSVDNLVKLYPAPTSNARTDLVFLEVWRTLVSPNPSSTNKPSASTIWKYGNVKHGGVNLADDLQDPTLGFETTKRVQTQYRIRVFGQGVTGIDLANYADGLSSPSVLGQGTAATPQAGFFFTNMGKEMNDPSLWRAGDGNSANALGTVDGYVYAIPICAVFRRNSSSFVAYNPAGAANQNGSFNRRPTTNTLANPLNGAVTLQVLRLAAALPFNATLPVTVNVAGLSNSGIDDPLHYAGGNTLFAIIDEEIVEISAANTALNQITIASRGRYKTQTTRHEINAEVRFYSVRPDNLFADQVAPGDVLDLRHAVNPGAWDYNQLLTHNLAALMRNRLQSTWKQALKGNSVGPVVTETDVMYANAPLPPSVLQADGPDGIRTVFSDAAVIQRDVTMLLNNAAALNNGFTDPQFDTNMVWDVGASFVPSGFVNNEGLTDYWTNGSVIFVHVEGTSPTGTGARASFRWQPTAQAVKFLTPKEYWKVGYPQASLDNGDQYPVKMRFIGPETGQPPAFCLSQQPVTEGETELDANAAAKHPGPLYPWAPTNFEFPFIVLGDLLNSNMYITGRPITSLNSSRYQTEYVVEIDTGVLNFDTANAWYTVTNNATGSTPSAEFSVGIENTLSNGLLNNTRTLYDMLTVGGTQRTGLSSEIYVVVYGDPAAGHRNNNGVFKVVGAGTAVGKPASLGGRNFTQYSASNSTSLVCVPLSADFTGVGFDTAGGGTVNLQFRSQYSTVEGGTGNGVGDASAMCIVLTDIGGTRETPWNAIVLGDGQALPNFNFAVDTVTFPYPAIKAKAVLSMALQYSPARGAQTHVPDLLTRFALTTPTADYLRQPRNIADSTFPTLTGAPANESDYRPVNVQLWNRLPAFGWDAGSVDPVTGSSAPISYGGGIVANTEQDRESELFVDLGSKTAIFRPFRQRNMTLQAITVPHDNASATAPSLIGAYNYPAPFGFAKDSLQLFTIAGNLTPYNAAAVSNGKNMAFSVPPEYMPRFGRQDIPYYIDVANPAGSGVFLEGINHLFVDTTDPTQGQTVIMGGRDNAGPGNAVYSLFFRAAPTAFPGEQYGASGTNIDGAALNRPFYVARKAPLNVSSPAVVAKFNQVISSDLGGGLKGIQLPPYLGIARLYGVYEYTNYVAGGGITWTPDRATYIGLNNIAPLVPVQNLLRTDADAQSLFIMQDGAQDLTSETGDHTYIVPSNVIDVTKIPGYLAGQTFDDFQYVVECTVFGFAKDWINGNNYVLCRRHDGEGTLYADGDNPQIPTVQMVLPAPAHINAPVYSVVDRTVYQGDPFFTRTGPTATLTDYQHRYGTVPLSDASQLQYPIQQFDAFGGFIPVTYNPRAFEVLASIDFYTTMGTGKIGGRLYAGTPLDIGYIQNTPDVATRIPPNGGTDTQFLNVWDRAFTEGQKELPNRAGIIVNFLRQDSTLIAVPEILNGCQITLTNLAGKSVTKTGLVSPVPIYNWIEKAQVTAAVPTNVMTIYTVREHGLSVGDTVFIDSTGGTTPWLSSSHTVNNVVNSRVFEVAGGGVQPLTSVSPVDLGYVLINANSNQSTFKVATRDGSSLLSGTYTPDFVTAFGAGLAPGAGVTISFPLFGGKVGDTVVVNTSDVATFQNLTISGTVFDLYTVVVRFQNVGPVPLVIASNDKQIFITVTPRIIDIPATIRSLEESLLLDDPISQSIKPLSNGSNQLLLQSTVAGSEGNRNKVSVANRVLGMGIATIGLAVETTFTTVRPLSALFPHLVPSVGALNTVFMTGFGGANAASINDRYWVMEVTGTSAFKISALDSSALVITVPASGSAVMRPTLSNSPTSFVISGINPVENLEYLFLTSPSNNDWLSPQRIRVESNFVGGVDEPMNAGDGISNLSLTGMTERLPLGILLSDCDFMSENPLNDSASAVQTFPSALRPVQKLLPLASGGREYERFLGAAGDLVAQADGSILTYTAYNAVTAPAGTRAYRMYRGGGSLYGLDGLTPGGPVDWATTSFPPAIKPVLKGGVLVGKAMLVRNFPEVAFNVPTTTSYGDEIQMLIATYGVFGTVASTREGITLGGSIGSAGYGEGYGASDRYRIDGKPMFRDTTFRHIDPATVQPTPYVKGGA